MKHGNVRTRFAPAPSGTIHLGNIRAALINIIFAKKHNGKVILRVEDTDKELSSELLIEKLLQDLDWLHLQFDEGVSIGGQYGPYRQSERTEIYQKALNQLVSSNKVYRCFCSKERLEELRQEQVKAKIAPKYDRKCFNYGSDKVKSKIAFGTSFVWRYAINLDEIVVVKDLLRGDIKFEMKHFGDFVLSRSDGSFNFLLANLVDDIDMKISHVIRGEDHLTNSALQTSMYNFFQKPTPQYLHLPIMLDAQGNKLSKSKQNFNLEDLKTNGILPEAICSYLGILGSSLEEDAYSLDELVVRLHPENLSAQPVRYCDDKIAQINQKWLNKLSANSLLKRFENFTGHTISEEKSDLFATGLKVLAKEAMTLKELAGKAEFILDVPQSRESSASLDAIKQDKDLCMQVVEKIRNIVEFLPSIIDQFSTELKISKKDLFQLLRTSCTGKLTGIGMVELFSILPPTEIAKRVETFLN